MRRIPRLAVSTRCLSPLVSLFMLLAFAQNTSASEPIAAGTDYGAGITLQNVSDLATVLREAEAHTQEPVLLQGRISDVCQQKKDCFFLLGRWRRGRKSS